MQASSFGVKGATFGVQKQKTLVVFGSFGNGSVMRPSRVCMPNSTNCCGLRLGSVTMETEMSSTRLGSTGIFGSPAKPRSLRVQASGLYAVADGFDLFDL